MLPGQHSELTPGFIHFHNLKRGKNNQNTPNLSVYLKKLEQEEQ